MSKSNLREVHIFCSSRSRKLRRLVKELPNLRPNHQCDPANIPPGSVCYQYPRGSEREFEEAASIEGLAFEWGGLGGNYECVFVVGDYMYAGSSSLANLEIFDVSNPASPVNVGSLSIDAGATAIWVDGFVCYMTDTAGDLYTINIDDPTTPVLFTDGQAQAGEDWSHVRVSGELAVMSGGDRSAFEIGGSAPAHFALYNSTTRPPMEIQLSNQPGGCVALQGRRLFVCDTTGSPVVLRNYRLGGFRCASIAADRMQADELAAEQINARHGYFSGEIVADVIGAAGGDTDTRTGVLWAANYIRLGSIEIRWGSGDPNAVVTAPRGSTFHRTDTGAIYRNTDGATAWTAM